MAKGGFPGGGNMNMNNLMKQAQKLQKQMDKMQENLANKEFEATVGGGAVTAKVNGKYEILSIEIEPEVVDPDDIEMLQDLIISACNEALRKAEKETEGEMQKITGEMNMPGMF